MSIVKTYKKADFTDILPFDIWSNYYETPNNNLFNTYFMNNANITTFNKSPIIEIKTSWSPVYLQPRFYDVITDLQKGWKLVGTKNNTNCTDCYIYGDPGCINIFNNCDKYCDNWMSYEEFKSISDKKYYYPYYDFNNLHKVDEYGDQLINKLHDIHNDIISFKVLNIV